MELLFGLRNYVYLCVLNDLKLSNFIDYYKLFGYI